MNINTSSIKAANVVLTLSLSLFCFVALGQENLGTVKQPIISGKIVNADEQQLRGLVTVGGCSGVLIANDWLLTAGHCITNNQDPTSVNVTANWGGSQSSTGDAVYQFGEFRGPKGSFMPVNPDPRGPDLALVHLSQPFTINGSRTGFSNRLYASSITGKTVASYGQGTSNLPGAGGGTWRAADLVVSTATGEYYTVKPNSQGQIGAPGDSGGPGFIWENGVPFITGIQSGCTWTTDAVGNITAITGCTMISIPAVHEWIHAVLTTQWNPRATSQPVWVHAPELRGTRWEFSDVNQVGWSQAARSAAAMCYNRGFVGGHFDGHQDVAKGAYGIQCSGNGTVWRDATAAEIAATQWGFTDVDQVSWAQANRAAERLCATANQGFAGGHFNGHMANGRYGLFCYRDGAQWFDATDPELAATGFGFPTPKLDDVLWAQASRAAVGFCRGKGFGGGFMNGHQIPGKYGVVCQK